MVEQWRHKITTGTKRKAPSGGVGTFIAERKAKGSNG